MKHLLYIVLSLFTCFHLLAQPPYAHRWDNIAVKKEDGTLFKFPWAGGLNSPQFSVIDVDMDGIDDLFIFDRTSNKVVVFKNLGKTNEASYIHAPEYENMFPEMNDFALLVDYNCDGKSDIFTYSNADMKVYRNDSEKNKGLKFTLVVNSLGSVYNPPKKLNLYVSSIDIPAIRDFDGDGDVDIATFGILGTTVEYHRNQSIEKYGTCDSLEYMLETSCWGDFSENTTNNSVSLNVSCKGATTFGTEHEQHSGSTLLALDMDCDEDLELVLGDVTYSNMVMVTNGGDKFNAHMVAQDPKFPSVDMPVDINVFPAAFHLDVNNDGKRDLIAAPNFANIAENTRSVWYYRNTGTDDCPDFEFVQDDFLQENMIEVGHASIPLFFDYNNDQLPDLLVSNLAYYASSGLYKSGISLYENTGTSLFPSFKLITRDFINTFSLQINAIYPALGDIDDDGDMDMVIGEATGVLHLFENVAQSGGNAKFQLTKTTLEDTTGKAIDIGHFSTPFLVDIDRDSLLDLLIGEKQGNINYYKNVGTKTAAKFALITEDLGEMKVDPINYLGSYSAPFVLDSSGYYHIYSGAQNGRIYHYTNIDNNLAGKFTLSDSLLYNVYNGQRSTLYMADLNSDNIPDLVTGNIRGGVTLYKGSEHLVSIQTNMVPNTVIRIIPNPTAGSVQISWPTGQRINNLKVYSITGQQIISKNVTSRFEEQLDLPDLSNGLYLVILEGEEGIISERLVISR